MKEDLIQYIKNNKLNKSRIDNETKDAAGRLLPQRNLFVKLKQYAEGFLDRGEEPRLLALAGLRGVGKTTLMWQTAKYIFENKTKEIYFINVDNITNLGYKLHDVFDIFELQILSKPFYELNQPIIFLIDEVHEAEGWDKDLKILYERCKKAFILCTGSSALLLHQSPDLASRWSLIRLYPFRFAEFIHAKSWMINYRKQLYAQKGLGGTLKQLLFYSENITTIENEIRKVQPVITQYFTNIENTFNQASLKELINEYISYHNIARFLTIQNKSLINDRIIELFERILYKDIPVFATIESNDIQVMFRLLLRLALSDDIHMGKLAGTIGCTQKQVEQFIETLHKAEILNVLTPYGGTGAKTGTNKKAFFMSPSLRRALFQSVYGDKLEAQLRAKLYEDIVAMYLRRVLQEPGLLSFGATWNNASPDFIVETMDSPIVIEVGTHKSTVRQTEKYQQNKRYGIIINANETNYSIRGNTLIIPLSWFLLL